MVCASLLGPQEFSPCVLFSLSRIYEGPTLIMSRDIVDGGATFQKGKGHLFDHLPLVSRFRNFEARDTIRVTATLQVTTLRFGAFFFLRARFKHERGYIFQLSGI